MASIKTDIRTLNIDDPSVEKNFYMKMSINGVEVVTNTIASIVVREWIFDVLPRLEIEMFDNGRFIDQFPFQDNDVIRIQLGIIEDEMVLDTDFYLQDYELNNVRPGTADQTYIKLTGLLKVDKMTFPINNRSFGTKKTSEIIRTIANECGIDVDVKKESLDSMKWLQVNQTNLQFIEHMKKRSFVGDDDLQFIYGTRDNKLIYTTMKTEYGKENDVKVAIFDEFKSMINGVLYDRESIDKVEQDDRANYKSEDLLYYNNFKYKNIAGTINKDIAYGKSYNYFDFSSEQAKEYINDDKYFGDNSLKEANNVGTIVDTDVFGYYDKDNQHQNFYEAIIQNEYLEKNMFSSMLILYTRPVKSLKLFDVINVKVPSNLPLESDVDEVHSGLYIVGGIIHNAALRGIYSNVVILFRNTINIKGYLEDFETRHS